jgi:hypothetical protein
MARLGRKDRGLYSKLREGKAVWFVRLYHIGRESRFGSFPTKTAAREFYEKAKREQKEGLSERAGFGGRGAGVSASTAVAFEWNRNRNRNEPTATVAVSRQVVDYTGAPDLN